jgi:NAD(P)-dependent dehydrogenase (short-subunit alcohol dehydrogenase family)
MSVFPTGGTVERAIVISASSDIGHALSQRWSARGVRVFGTYRIHSGHVEGLRRSGVQLVYCDVAKRESIQAACAALREMCPRWDVLVLCTGSQEPIGPFIGTNFDGWEESVTVNFVGPLRIIRELLPARHLDPGREPTVQLFAGGGPNKATVNASAYAVSKVALIKMCELLDAEVPDTRFVIVNPGWVKTKIHAAMLAAGPAAGDDYQRTVERLASGEFTPMERVLECCDWLIGAPRRLVSGRYFGVGFDDWGSEELARRLAGDPNRYKLRRLE